MKELFERADDLRAGSTELAAAIADWSSDYQLTYRSTNLLAPLRIREGLRVLDVTTGAGVGTLARFLAERGADVVALASSYGAAEATAVRCAALPNVEVVCGEALEFGDPDGFDVVLDANVVDAEATTTNDRRRRHLAGLLRSDGVLVLGVENGLGVKFLVGHAPGRSSRPWAWDGRAPDGHARTSSRRAVTERLAAAGLRHQAWHFAFPDHRTAGVILSDDAYREPDARDLVDQLVRWPCSSELLPMFAIADDRRAHRALLDAGLGADVANSFLVFAAASEPALDRHVERATVAWHFGWDRSPQWSNAQRVSSTHFEPLIDADPVRVEWLERWPRVRRERIIGRTIEQRAIEALSDGRRGLEAVIRRWDHFVHSMIAPGSTESAFTHPFLPPGSTTHLPERAFDVTLSNFVEDRSGRLHHIDDEWGTPPAVDADLARVRALWHLAADFVRHGVDHGGDPETCVDDLALEFAAYCDLATPPSIRAFRASEAEFNALLADKEPAIVEEYLAYFGTRSAASIRRQQSTEGPDPPNARDDEIAALHNALAEIRRSRSWRVTAPLRWVTDRFRSG